MKPIYQPARHLAGLSLLTAVMLTGGRLAAADADAAPAFTPKAAFEKLKGLAGEWRGKATHGEASSDTRVTYRVIGAGSAVLESLFPGTAHEMLTVYYLDGDKLVLTHYCASGNQPHMTLDLKASSPQLLVFGFSGGTNLDPARDMHMHAGRLRLVNTDTLENEWDSYQDGRKIGAAKFSLTRAAPAAAVPGK
jgi:hypothetical protein